MEVEAVAVGHAYTKWTVVPRRISPDRFCTKAVTYVLPSIVEIPH